MSGLTAIVLAGSRPGRDAFAEEHGTDLKALILVGGEAMVRRPVAALLSSDRIAAVRVLAQQAPRIAQVLPSDPRLTVDASGATIAETLERVCSDPSTRWPVLLTTADHALLDAAMIDDFCNRSADADIAIAVVERQSLLKRLPATRRTWIRFRGGAYSGANLFLLGSPSVAPAIALWRSVEQDRKKGWRLLWAMGPALFLGSVLRLLTLQEALRRIGRKLRLDVRAVEMANPLAAVDVDKPGDHALVEAILAGRA
ncbi:NTP transferase domain-containing protein [Sphingomonas sp.]|uniref:NTP transferase domain-containing protein n=1 Tax=Sphingomonas sp. TaxID=28214 RepID=UPI0018243860|nr:NTP transferase domain-containing protein [Sphingomonas sp.]MBA3511952.1 NTP transferase domain-containing protein [Sphingomonas sp.]